MKGKTPCFPLSVLTHGLDASLLTDHLLVLAIFCQKKKDACSTHLSFLAALVQDFDQSLLAGPKRRNQ